MTYEGLMVSISGVRGRVGEALTPEVMARFAAGFGAWALAGLPTKLPPATNNSNVARIVVARHIEKFFPTITL